MSKDKQSDLQKCFHCKANYLLCDCRKTPTFYAAQVDSPIANAIRADRKKLIEAIQNDICLEVHSDSMVQADCNGERWKAESIVRRIRSTPLEQGDK